jgi:hypothetical protein
MPETHFAATALASAVKFGNWPIDFAGPLQIYHQERGKENDATSFRLFLRIFLWRL